MMTIAVRRFRHAFDLYSLDFRSHFPDRAFDRELDRNRGRRATVAASLHAQAHHAGALVSFRNFDAAAVRAEIWPHFLERVVHPRREILGMESVKDEQAGDKVILGE